MKKIRLLTSSFLTVCILISGCSNADKSKADEKSAFDLTTVKKEIEDSNRQFADLFVKGDSVGVANLYTTDAKFMDAGAPSVVGRPAIQSTMAGFIKSGLTKVDFKTTDVFGCDTLVAEEGLLKLYVKDQTVADEKYIVLWKREDGKWKIFRDISNSNLPARSSK